jgi:hypothetical protein
MLCSKFHSGWNRDRDSGIYVASVHSSPGYHECLAVRARVGRRAGASWNVDEQLFLELAPSELGESRVLPAVHCVRGAGLYGSECESLTHRHVADWNARAVSRKRAAHDGHTVLPSGPHISPWIACVQSDTVCPLWPHYLAVIRQPAGA